jgi:hypothetical protein
VAAQFMASLPPWHQQQLFTQARSIPPNWQMYGGSPFLQTPPFSLPTGGRQQPPSAAQGHAPRSIAAPSEADSGDVSSDIGDFYDPQHPGMQGLTPELPVVPVTGVAASDFLFQNIAEDTRPGDKLEQGLSARWRLALNVDGKGDEAWNPNAAAEILTRHYKPGYFPIPKPNLQIKYGPSEEMYRMHKLSHALAHSTLLGMHTAALLKQELVDLLVDHPDAAALLDSQFPSLLKASPMMATMREGLAMVADLANTFTQVRRAEKLPTGTEHAAMLKYLQTVSPSWKEAFFHKELIKHCPESKKLADEMIKKVGTPAVQPQQQQNFRYPGAATPAHNSYSGDSSVLPPCMANFPRVTKGGQPIYNMGAFYKVVQGVPTANLPPDYVPPVRAPRGPATTPKQPKRGGKGGGRGRK